MLVTINEFLIDSLNDSDSINSLNVSGSKLLARFIIGKITLIKKNEKINIYNK